MPQHGFLDSTPRDSAVFGYAGVAAAVAGYCLLTLALLFSKKKTPAPLPPSPPGEFLLGHYRAVPIDAPFKRYAEWGEEYNSDVLFFETFGTKWVVLNSVRSAIELLEKRGSNYADRPRFVMFEEMGWSPTLTWLRWGPKYHLHRRALQPPFTKAKARQYTALQRKEALICCKSMIEDTSNSGWLNAVRRCSVAIVLKIAYGLDVDGPESPWIDLAEKSASAIGKAGAPGSSIMDLFPSTRYLPDWLPFMERLRYAHTWRAAIQNITELPFKASLSQMASKLDRRFFTHNGIASLNEKLNEHSQADFGLEDIKGAAATVLIAGNDTTAATVTLLILYLMQNPHVQRKAQEEVDRVVGRDRLPTWEDTPNLPYMNLVLQETYRMNPLSPLGIPHASVKDDIYEGMFIPKGTIVYQNVWAMSHDPSVYADPFRFHPERYLPREEGGNGEPLPVGNFGFGRRICIGRNLAENSLLIVLATMLATVDIGWPLGPDGKPTPFEPEWSLRGQATVMPFEASVTSRSSKSEALLNIELDALHNTVF
ncbi:cytochrome P450 [Cercophora newfieldiana]|uniref:Cytochrome P450 n=1 Tax=Cercophora newfieldiana TaxID=92897 RepID=A0AA40CX99_9PEZI|nr:cytochrome P450 [Cercophora newfieldiana]